MNEFLNEWQPKEEVNGYLSMNDRGYGSTDTIIHSSEGDTVFIRQESSGTIDHVSLTRHELYDLIFNFMSTPELVEITNRKINPDYQLVVKLKK